MHCTQCSIPKGTSKAEATSNSERIKCVALAIGELHWSEGIRQVGRRVGGQVGRLAVSQLLEIPLNKKFCNNLLKAFNPGQSESLVFPNQYYSIVV